MPRQSYIIDRDTGQLVDSATFHAKRWEKSAGKVSDLPMPYIRGDLPAYKSPVTGKVIEGRAARREDLARTGCRELDPSEYKPKYSNYEFCQKRRLPYMGGDVPPPMTADEKAQARWKKQAAKAAEKAADNVRAAKAEANTDPDLAKFKRGNTKSAPIFKNNTVKE